MWDNYIYESIYILYTNDTIYAWNTVTMELSSNDKLYLILLWVLLLIELNTYEHNLELLKITIRGDRGYVGHFLVFQLSNVFKDEIRKNKSIEVFSWPLFMFIIYFNFFFVKLFNSYSIKRKQEKWRKKAKKFGWMGQRQGLNRTRFYSETAELYLLKDTLVKRKFLSLSEVLCFHLLYEV